MSASPFSCALLGSIPSDGVIRWAPGTRVGYVPQKLDLERDLPMTGNDLLRARLTLAGHSGFTIAQTLDLVGLSNQTGDQLIGTYSGGQFQRLLIAFALLGEPTVLLLDEPTASIDEAGQEQLDDLMHRVQSERTLTVLFISHDLSVVYGYADTVLCIGHQQVYGRGLVSAVGDRASDRSGRRGDVSAEPAPAARFRGTTTHLGDARQVSDVGARDGSTGGVFRPGLRLRGIPEVSRE